MFTEPFKYLSSKIQSTSPITCPYNFISSKLNHSTLWHSIQSSKLSTPHPGMDNILSMPRLILLHYYHMTMWQYNCTNLNRVDLSNNIHCSAVVLFGYFIGYLCGRGIWEWLITWHTYRLTCFCSCFVSLINVLSWGSTLLIVSMASSLLLVNAVICSVDRRDNVSWCIKLSANLSTYL